MKWVVSSFYDKGFLPPFSPMNQLPTLASSVIPRNSPEAFDGHFHPGYLDPLHVPGWFEIGAEPTFFGDLEIESCMLKKRASK